MFTTQSIRIAHTLVCTPGFRKVAKKLGLDPRTHFIEVTREIVRLAARAAKDH